MTEEKPLSSPHDDDQLKEALAVLISCTRNKKRPLPLTEVAMWLELAVSRLGSYAAVADRIGLSSKMLRQFAYIRRLSAPVQKLFKTRRLDSVDAAVHLSALNARDQLIMAQALASGEIDTGDTRAVIQLWRTEQSSPIVELIKRVRESKTRREFVAEFVVRGDGSRRRILGAFEKYIPASEIAQLELRGALGRLVLTGKGKQSLAKAARTLSVPLKRVIPYILEDIKRA